MPERNTAKLRITQGSRFYTLESNSENFKAELDGSTVKVTGLKAGRDEFLIRDQYSDQTVKVGVTVKEGLVISDTELSMLNDQTRRLGVYGTGHYDMKLTNGKEGYPDLIVIAEARGKAKQNEDFAFYAHWVAGDSLEIMATRKGEGSITLTDLDTGLSEKINISVDWKDLTLSRTDFLLHPGDQEILLATTGSWFYHAETDRPDALEVTQEQDYYFDYETNDFYSAPGNNFTLKAKPVNRLVTAHVTVRDDMTGQTQTATVQVTPYVSTPYSGWFVEGPKVITTTPLDIPIAGSGQFSATSSDPSMAIVTVSDSILTLRGLKAGEVSIVVTDDVSKERAQFTANIYEPLRLEPDHIVLDKEGLQFVNVYGGGEDYYASSDNPDIADCGYGFYDNDLLAVGVEAVNPGKTTATVTDRVTGLTKTFTVTVLPSAFKPLKLSKDEVFIRVGDWYGIEQESSGFENLEVKSSDESVATVEVTWWGRIDVKGHQWGNCVITVSDKKSGMSQEVRINVFKWTDSAWFRDEQTYSVLLEGSGQYEVQEIKDMNPGSIPEYVVTDDPLVSTQIVDGTLFIAAAKRGKLGQTILRITDLETGKVSMMDVTVAEPDDAREHDEEMKMMIEKLMIELKKCEYEIKQIVDWQTVQRELTKQEQELYNWLTRNQISISELDHLRQDGKYEEFLKKADETKKERRKH